jgi:lipopolysaccharide transport system ATP-binding protein
MSDIAIQTEGLSKRYRIGTFVPYGRLTESIADFVRHPFKRRGETPEWIWALRDVSLEVRHGEVLGIVGRNGAGKTTLLKILSRITDPSGGLVRLRGRVGSLLEVGTGFHPELTGRENIYLNGAILGMRREEIRRKFDPIIEFAEIERFLDTPVKRYSSGMYIRLAFAVAAHLEPEVLLVDEVLAVGDAAFQAKCLGRMNDIAREGRTVVFVSHNMGAITKLCSRVVWIEDGHLAYDGAPTEVVGRYLSSSVATDATWSADGDVPGPTQRGDAPGPTEQEVVLLAAGVRDVSGQQARSVRYDEPFRVDLSYRVAETVENATVLFSFMDLAGNLIFESWDTDSDPNGHAVRPPGVYQSTCFIPRSLLKPGRYWLNIAAHIPNRKVFERRDHVLAFDVLPVEGRVNTERLGLLSPVLEWEIHRVS